MSSLPNSELIKKACNGKIRSRMEPDSNPLSNRSVGYRLELIRQAMDVNDKTMAAMIGASPQKWGNWKMGRNAIPHDYAAKLCAVTGATTDFIYRDVRNAISVDLAEKLAKVAPAPVPSRVSRV